ncbi:hypothetical protein C8Q79DRAFT_929878 [Trametes meyenii]|nr:hypothetical protein C8Q79DRAFT_929878 [Trametes meyenii]
MSQPSWTVSPMLLGTFPAGALHAYIPYLTIPSRLFSDANRHTCRAGFTSPSVPASLVGPEPVMFQHPSHYSELFVQNDSSLPAGYDADPGTGRKETNVPWSPSAVPQWPLWEHLPNFHDLLPTTTPMSTDEVGSFTQHWDTFSLFDVMAEKISDRSPGPSTFPTSTSAPNLNSLIFPADVAAEEDPLALARFLVSLSTPPENPASACDSVDDTWVSPVISPISLDHSTRDQAY